MLIKLTKFFDNPDRFQNGIHAGYINSEKRPAIVGKVLPGKTLDLPDHIAKKVIDMAPNIFEAADGVKVDDAPQEDQIEQEVNDDNGKQPGRKRRRQAKNK